MTSGGNHRKRAGRWAAAIAGLAMAGVPLSSFGTGDESERRAAMVAQIDFTARLTLAETGRARFADEVMAAMGRVPRHQFVPESERAHAYENRPLAIGYGQTISQPYIVALMTDLLAPDPGHVVLEVGTGSGYQAAVLAGLVSRVYTMEIVPELGLQAGERLDRLGYGNVEVRVGDGYYGWAEHAPFDAIIVTAASSHIPPPLVQQLKPGGKMIIPVGSQFFVQHLTIVEKLDDGAVRTRQVLPVRFVPLIGGN